MNRKKTPMFTSNIPTAYEFADFTDPNASSQPNGFGKPDNGAKQIKGNEVFNDIAQGEREAPKLAFESIATKFNQVN